MALKLITAPTILPITLAEAKAHLRVDHTDDDDLISIFIQSATDYVDGPEGFLGRALIDQKWQLVLDKFPDNEIRIPIPPLIEVNAIEYDDADGVPTTLATSSYTVDDVSQPAWVLPDGSWPATFDGINAVRITFRAGYVNTAASSGTLPGDIKAALLLTIGALYANREQTVVGQASTQLPWGAEQLLRRKLIDTSMA